MINSHELFVNCIATLCIGFTETVILTIYIYDQVILLLYQPVFIVKILFIVLISIFKNYEDID